jgi:replicative DNA helicase
MTAKFLRTADALASLRSEIDSGIGPVLYPVGIDALSHIEAGPGRVLLLGGAPGAGKTAFVMQAAVDALRMTPTLRVLVCNVEMSVRVLIERQLARLSGVDLNTIRFRKFEAEHKGRLSGGFAALASVAERLAFVDAPYTLKHVAECADAFGANMILLDYIQRIAPGDNTKHDTKRGLIDSSMSLIRRIADCERAVFVVSAVSRGKDSKGRASYASLGLASFRESSELEFAADDAFILEPADMGLTTLRHLKARHSEPRDLSLKFQKATQQFSPITPTQSKGAA